MTPVTRCLVVVLMANVLFGGFTSEAHNYNFYTFLTILNGDFDNFAQVENNTEGFDFIQARFIPVEVGSLSDAPVLFLEEAANGKIIRSYVNEIITDKDSRLIKLIYHNVIKPSFYQKYKYKNGMIEISPALYVKIGSPPGTITIDEVSNLQLQDLQELFNCSAEFEAFGNANFIGTWENCPHTVNGVKSFNAFDVYCDDFFVIVSSPDAPEKTSHAPYHMRRTSSRYPVPGEPDIFISGCDQGK